MSDRDEQIKRLAAAIGSTSDDLNRGIAENLYDAGARVPDPPRPSLPVVSEEALTAYYDGIGQPYNDRSLVTPAKFPMLSAGLRAAFQIMLRDTVNALPRELYSGWESIYFPRTDGSQPRWWFPLAAMPDFIRALTGGAP